MSFLDISLGVMVGAYFIALGAGLRGMLPEALRGNKMIMIFGVVILVGNTAISLLEKKVAAHRPSPQELVRDVLSNLSLPLQVDPMLRLENVTPAPDGLAYHFSVMADTEEAYQKKLVELNDWAHKNGCQMNGIKAGYNVRINYSAPMKLGGQDSQMVVTPKDCGYTSPEEAATPR